MQIKKTFLLIFVLGTITLVLFFIGLFLLQKSNNVTQTTPSTTIYPSSTPIENVYPEKLNITPKNVEKSLDRFSNRTPLSQSDLDAKNRLVSSMGSASGTLFQTKDFRIDYVKTPDDIEVDILSKNLSSAKTDAVNWLLQQGLSVQGICNLPVNFFIDFQVKNALPAGTVFDPNPPNCQ